MTAQMTKADRRKILQDNGFFSLYGPGPVDIPSGDVQMDNLPGSFPWEDEESKASTNENLQSTVKRPELAPPTIAEVERAITQLSQGKTQAAQELGNQTVITIGNTELSVLEVSLIGLAAGLVLT